MALFGTNKKEETKEDAQETKKAPVSQTNRPPKGKRVLLAPHVTEKSAVLSDDNVYTFQVDGNATKREVAQAVEDIYGVKPTKVRTVRLPGKKIVRRHGVGIRRRPKKAYVHLKKGDKIELF